MAVRAHPISMLDDLRMFLRYIAGVRQYLEHPLSAEESRRLLEAQHRNRDQSFLRLLQRSVFQKPRSPYLALLRRAGAEYGDIARMVQSDGLESALERLYDSGVYVALDEFKGRKPVVRAGLELPVESHDFDNPFLRKHFEGSTGGTRGVPRRLIIDLDLLVYDAACQHLFHEAWGLGGRPMALWRPLPPYVSGIKKPLLHAKVGQPLGRWFTQDRLEYSPRRLKYAILTHATVLAGRLSGVALPTPEHVPLTAALQIANWLARQRQCGTPAYLDTLVGCAVRICSAAKEGGLDISGSFFRLGSEPYTSAKARMVRDSGVQAGCFYAMAETGPVGVPCPDGEAVDDVHLLSGKIAVIERRTSVRPAGASVSGFHFTSVLASSPKILINVETGDYGALVRRRCSCPFGALGFNDHLHSIRSYEKLTSEGVAFLGSDLFALVEEVLPRKFGGSPTDYQLVETEVDGLPSVEIVVSPRVHDVIEASVQRTVLDYLGSRNDSSRTMARIWEEGQTLRVVRREPAATPGGKILPLHLQKG